MRLWANSPPATMAENSEKELRRIFSLLDDPDENIVLNAMAELLSREEELGTLPGEFQESDDPVMRKRIHQLQAALTLRRRRKYFLARLYDPQADFLDILVELHLQWFDNDSRPEVEALLASFVVAFMCEQPTSLEDIMGFMIRHNFSAESETTLKPENYCIGSVMTEHAGSGALLAALCSHLVPAEAGLALGQFGEDFVVYDQKYRVLVPAKNWQILEDADKKQIRPRDLRDLIRYCSANLFSAAVNSDSFRYVLTIAQAHCGSDDDTILNFLPYPFHPPEDTDREP